jgi:hypothetical protein
MSKTQKQLGKQRDDTWLMWEKIWQVISSLQGLVELRVEIETSPAWEDDWMQLEQNGELFNLPGTVTSPQIFEVFVPWELNWEVGRRRKRKVDMRTNRENISS